MFSFLPLRLDIILSYMVQVDCEIPHFMMPFCSFPLVWHKNMKLQRSEDKPMVSSLVHFHLLSLLHFHTSGYMQCAIDFSVWGCH